MELKIGFKSNKISANGKTLEELEQEVRATNEANIQAYLESQEETNQE